MSPERFRQVFEDEVEACRQILIEKAGEYAPGGDRLQNFKTAGALQGRPPEVALQGMLAKHTVALNDFLNELNGGLSPRPLDQWNEKIRDSLNYLFLLKGLLMERLWVPE